MGLLDKLLGQSTTPAGSTNTKTRDERTARTRHTMPDACQKHHSVTHILRLLSDVTNNTQDLTATTNLALSKICEYTSWPLGHAYIVERANGKLVARSTKQWYIHPSVETSHIQEFKELSEATEFTIGQGLIGEVLQSKEFTSADDVTRLPGYMRADAARNNAIHGSFAFPVQDLENRSVRCILEFFSYEKVSIDDEFLTLTEFISKQIAFAYSHIDAQNQRRQLAKHFEESISSNFGDMQKYARGMTELAHGIQTAISEVLQLSTNAKEIVNNSMYELEESKQRANQLQNSTKEISGIASTINKIADQTNLLALNATIEAARAGEVGRGFAVVAEEVKALARHTGESTSRVTEMVANIELVSSDIQSSLDASKVACGNAIESVTNIENAVDLQKVKTTELDAASEELLRQTQLFAVTVEEFLAEISG